jgi:hypothetical protein
MQIHGHRRISVARQISAFSGASRMRRLGILAVGVLVLVVAGGAAIAGSLDPSLAKTSGAAAGGAGKAGTTVTAPAPGGTGQVQSQGAPGTRDKAADPQQALFGFDAPVLEVDRFSDAAATRLRRSSGTGYPAPGAPMDLDSPLFLRKIEGKDGTHRSCYDLDLRPSAPGRFFVFYDDLGNFILPQLPVVDRIPGDPSYSDIWDIWKVTIPRGAPIDNRIRDVETIEKLLKNPDSGYSSVRTGSLLNAPIVPDGSHAGMKADDKEGQAALRYAWYRGKRAPYLYFEEHLVSDGPAPVSRMELKSSVDPAKVGKDHAVASVLPVIRNMPGQPGYSPLMIMLGADGKPLYDVPLNCPVVGKAMAISSGQVASGN